MSDAVSFAEIAGQHVELLPARTVLSMFSAGCGCEGHGSSHGGGGDGGVGGAGGKGTGGIGLNILNIDVLGDQTNSAADGIGGNGGSANGGRG
jgi:hypothetical protein